MAKVKFVLKFLVGFCAAVVIGMTIFWYSRPADLDFGKLKSSVHFHENSRFAAVDGVNLHYQDQGQGEPIVLLHGYTSSTYTWKELVPKLAASHRVIAVDLKGFGFSDKPGGNYSRREQARLVAKLLTRLEIGPALIAGNSMGGEIAINLALDNPKLVSRLVLVDSAGVRVAGRSSLAPWYLRLPVAGPVVTSLALTSDSLIREGLKKSYEDDAKIDESTIAAYYRPLSTRNGQAAAIAARIQFDLDPVHDRIAGINVPTLILWGANDEIIPLDAGKELNRIITGSKLVVIEKCGHLPQEESPQRVLQEMLDFMSANKNVQAYL